MGHVLHKNILDKKKAWTLLGIHNKCFKKVKKKFFFYCFSDRYKIESLLNLQPGVIFCFIKILAVWKKKKTTIRNTA